MDLTEAPLKIAERIRGERGLANVRFQFADAERLPFANGEFDVVVSRFAFHHFEDPGAPLLEMVRVCREGGVVAIEDLTASEQPERAAYHNRFERLRDSSHVRALPLSELRAIFSRCGLEIETVYSGEIVQLVERWLANAQTPPKAAAEVHDLLARDEREDLSGTHPFRKDGQLCFTHTTAALVGRKPATPRRATSTGGS